MDTNITLNNEQMEALNLMKAGANVFLTGEAGSGKSAVLHAFQEQCDDRTVFLAPTGLAASNIKGQTIHSFCRFNIGLLCPDTIEDVTDPRFKALLNAAKTIVIDEISMVRSDLFAAIDHRLRSVTWNQNHYKFFAGKQLIVVGDFFQLPPIVSSQQEEIFLKTKLGGIYPFEIPLWDKMNFAVVNLKTVYRQGQDTQLLQILRNIRSGDTCKRDIQVPGITQAVNCISALNILSKKTPGADNHPICLCTTKKEADRINASEIQRTHENMQTFHAQKNGIFNAKDYPTEEVLNLCVGARIMTIANSRIAGGGYEYVNGDTGYITGFEEDEDGLGTVSVAFDDGRTATLTPYKWTVYRYELEVDRMSGRQVIKQIEHGSFTQIPLRLAYAITIHKSQGMGFDQVHLFTGNGCFASGQLYTALSRCRSLSGLFLDKNLTEADVLCDPKVVDFYHRSE